MLFALGIGLVSPGTVAGSPAPSLCVFNSAEPPASGHGPCNSAAAQDENLAPPRQTAPQLAQITSGPGEAPLFSVTPLLGERDDRLSSEIPGRLAMGTPFPLRVLFPAMLVAQVWIRELDAFHTPLQPFLVPVQRAPDGHTYAMITPLLQGDVHIRVVANFYDFTWANREFDVHVGPPDQAPAGFWADESLHQSGLGMVMRLHLGSGLGSFGILQPGAVFASVPNRKIWLMGGVTYRVVPDGEAPVVSVDDKGTITPLRAGKATIEVGLGAFTTSVDVIVTE